LRGGAQLAPRATASLAAARLGRHIAWRTRLVLATKLKPASAPAPVATERVLTAAQQPHAGAVDERTRAAPRRPRPRRRRSCACSRSRRSPTRLLVMTPPRLRPAPAARRWPRTRRRRYPRQDWFPPKDPRQDWFPPKAARGGSAESAPVLPLRLRRGSGLVPPEGGAGWFSGKCPCSSYPGYFPPLTRVAADFPSPRPAAPTAGACSTARRTPAPA